MQEIEGRESHVLVLMKNKLTHLTSLRNNTHTHTHTKKKGLHKELNLENSCFNKYKTNIHYYCIYY
jgi:hypothetical protein